MFRVKTEDFLARVRVWSDKADRRVILRDPAARTSKQHRHNLQTRLQDGLVIRTVHLNYEDDLFLEEVIDTVGFTRMDVIFECPGDIPSTDSAILTEIRSKAMEVAHQFLRAYRVVSEQVDVRLPTENDSPAVLVFLATKYALTREEVTAEFKGVQNSFQWLPPYLTGAAKGFLTVEKLDMLITLLDRGLVPRLDLELLLEAKEQSFVHGNHRLAIVIAQSGFEAFVQARLILECTVRGIVTLTPKGGKESDVETAIAKGGLRDALLGEYMTFLAGRSLKDGSEYNGWLKNAYEPRNQIVHRGRVNITEPEAKNAFESVVKYCDYINRMLNESRTST